MWAEGEVTLVYSVVVLAPNLQQNAQSLPAPRGKTKGKPTQMPLLNQRISLEMEKAKNK
jgi:hypothetical protein